MGSSAQLNTQSAQMFVTYNRYRENRQTHAQLISLLLNGTRSLCEFDLNRVDVTRTKYV